MFSSRRERRYKIEYYIRWLNSFKKKKNFIQITLKYLLNYYYYQYLLICLKDVTIIMVNSFVVITTIFRPCIVVIIFYNII